MPFPLRPHQTPLAMRAGPFSRNIGKALVSLVVGSAVAWPVGATPYYADAFRTNAQFSGAWYWLTQPHYAEWEFWSLALPWADSLSLEALVFVRADEGRAPAEIGLRLKVGTLGGPDFRTYLVRLQRVYTSEAAVGYFGQLILSRRELKLGSRLVVALEGRQTTLPLGLSSTSLRITTPSYAGQAAVATPAALDLAGSHGGLDQPSRTPSDRWVRLTADSHRSQPIFLSPGTYQAELGWDGPYTAPDLEDCYQVNLRVGQVISLRLELSHGPGCTLWLLDPAGQKVAEIEGNWMGLEYRAPQPGVWKVVVLCRESGPKFTYHLTVGIRNGA